MTFTDKIINIFYHSKGNVEMDDLINAPHILQNTWGGGGERTTWHVT